MDAGTVPGRLGACIVSGSYIVYKDGVELARADSLIWVRLAESGIYLMCDEEEGEGIFLGGEIYHVRGCAPLPGKETVTLDYIEE